MDHKRLENINVEVNTLLNDLVEGLWQEEEDFTNISTGELSGLHSFGYWSSIVPLVFHGKRLSSEPGLALSLDTYLPSLSESSLGVLKLYSVNGSQKEERGYENTVSPSKNIGPFNACKCRRQWAANKVIKMMVLGSDIDLEDPCRMTL
jgi:hypothetical protein